MLREPKIGRGFDWGQKFERSVPTCRIENYRVSRRIKDNKIIGYATSKHEITTVHESLSHRDIHLYILKTLDRP